MCACSSKLLKCVRVSSNYCQHSIVAHEAGQGVVSMEMAEVRTDRATMRWECVGLKQCAYSRYMNTRCHESYLNFNQCVSSVCASMYLMVLVILIPVIYVTQENHATSV